MAGRDQELEQLFIIVPETQETLSTEVRKQLVEKTAHLKDYQTQLANEILDLLIELSRTLNPVDRGTLLQMLVHVGILEHNDFIHKELSTRLTQYKTQLNGSDEKARQPILDKVAALTAKLPELNVQNNAQVTALVSAANESRVVTSMLYASSAVNTSDLPKKEAALSSLSASLDAGQPAGKTSSSWPSYIPPFLVPLFLFIPTVRKFVNQQQVAETAKQIQIKIAAQKKAATDNALENERLPLQQRLQLTLNVLSTTTPEEAQTSEFVQRMIKSLARITPPERQERAKIAEGQMVLNTTANELNKLSEERWINLYNKGSLKTIKQNLLLVSDQIQARIDTLETTNSPEAKQLLTAQEAANAMFHKIEMVESIIPNLTKILDYFTSWQTKLNTMGVDTKNLDAALKKLSKQMEDTRQQNLSATQLQELCKTLSQAKVALTESLQQTPDETMSLAEKTPLVKELSTLDLKITSQDEFIYVLEKAFKAMAISQSSSPKLTSDAMALTAFGGATNSTSPAVVTPPSPLTNVVSEPPSPDISRSASPSNQ